MKMLPAALAIAVTLVGGSAIAHPTNVPFESYGKCTAELNQQNKVDRDRVGGFFPSNGAAQISMLNNWECEYDPDTDAWYFSGQMSGGDNLGNGHGQADPGGDR